MSADHSLDRQPGIDRLAADINDVKRQLSELRTLQPQGSAALNLAQTAVYEAHSLVPILDAQAILFRWRMNNVSGKMVFSTFHCSIFQDAIAPANQIGGNNILGYGYRWYAWRDQLNSDGNDVQEYVWVENRSGVAHTIYLQGFWRYIVNGGSATVS
jgi:hypothetical protein